MVEVGTNVFAMAAGNADNTDNTIDSDDLSSWRLSNGISFDYASNGLKDLNLDGVINAFDRNLYWKTNSGKSSQVPGA